MLVFYAGNFLVMCFVVFAGGFGENGCCAWCFCGVDVVDCMGRWFVGGRFFEGGIFCRFLGFIFEGEEGIPQGLKPPFLCLLERPKAKALGYLEGRARAKRTCNGDGNDKKQIPFGDDKQEGQQQQQGRNTGILRCAQDDDLFAIG
jgi:hypothetical protein